MQHVLALAQHGVEQRAIAGLVQGFADRPLALDEEGFLALAGRQPLAVGQAHAVAATDGKAGRVVACSSYTELLAKLSSPHLIILSVPAGRPVDDVCSKLIDAGIKADDIIVDRVLAAA